LIEDRDMPAYLVGQMFRFDLTEIDKWVRAGGLGKQPNGHRVKDL